jgi:hypothetical protein
MVGAWIAVLIVLMGLSLCSFSWGLILYLASALLMPSLWLGEVALRVELVYCLWLVLVFLIRKSVTGSSFKWHRVLSWYGFFLAVVAISTATVLPIHVSDGSFTQLAVSFYGMFRPLIVMFLFLNAPDDEAFAWHVLWTLVWASIPIALLSIGQTISLNIATQVTLRCYVSPSRTPVLSSLKELGVILRSTGVFESPVNNGVFFLLVLVAAGFLLICSGHKSFQRWILYVSIGLAVVGGATTLSSTFLIGFVLVLMLFAVFVWPRYSHRFLRIAAPVICIGVLVAVLLIRGLAQRPSVLGVLNYEVQRILSHAVLQSRYNPTTGVLANTVQAILQRPFLGWGLTSIEGVFVGDSLYVGTLYRGGITGFFVFLSTIWLALRSMVKNRRVGGTLGKISQVAFLATLVVLVVGIGSPSFSILRLQEWVWAVIGLSLKSGSLKSGSRKSGDMRS